MNLDVLNPPLSEPIKKQALAFASQILDRINDTNQMSSPTSFNQNQNISDQNHSVVLVGRMYPPSFWENMLSKFGV